RIEQGEDALERVMRRHAVGQRQEPLKPTLTLLAKQGNVRPVIAVANHRADGHHNNVDQPMLCSSTDTRISQLGKMLLDRTHVSNRSHAFLRRAGEIRKNRRSVHLTKSRSPQQLAWSLMRSPWRADERARNLQQPQLLAIDFYRFPSVGHSL